MSGVLHIEIVQRRQRFVWICKKICASSPCMCSKLFLFFP